MARVAKPLMVALTDAGSDAGLIVDVALGERRRYQRRLHQDDFHVQVVGVEDFPLLGRQQRQRRDREAGVGDAQFAAPFLGCAVIR